MAQVIDVAEYILAKIGPMTAMKLQKLVYYSQAWHAVWDEQCLFESDIEAWANGPVSPELYEVHRGQFRVTTVGGNPKNLEADELSTIDAVIKFYGDKDAQYLSDLTHAEAPWRLARGRDYAGSGDRSNERITLEDMVEYYSSL